MTDRPILFSSAMVRALLDGRKTQTRRIIKDAPTDAGWICYEAKGERTWVGPNGYPSMPCTLRFAQGDRLWVREAWARTSVAPIIETIDNPIVVYRAGDNRTDYGGPWKPGIHMPRWASRLTLTVTDVRVQRLTDIDEIDALAEGIIRHDPTETDDAEFLAVDGGDIYSSAVDAYEALWNRINGALAWGANPWIVALTFTVEKRNVDA